MRRLKVVLLTEDNHPPIQAAYLAGANGFISKPFNLEDFHFQVSTFSQKIVQKDVVSHQLTHIDPLELYRRDIAAPGKIHPRL
jgi:hypothetical protein